MNSTYRHALPTDWPGFRKITEDKCGKIRREDQAGNLFKVPLNLRIMRDKWKRLTFNLLCNRDIFRTEWIDWL